MGLILKNFLSQISLATRQELEELVSKILMHSPYRPTQSGYHSLWSLQTHLRYKVDFKRSLRKSRAVFRLLLYSNAITVSVQKGGRIKQHIIGLINFIWNMIKTRFTFALNHESTIYSTQIFKKIATTDQIFLWFSFIDL